MQTEPPAAAPPKRKRRWFQFSLRTLLLLMPLAGIGARWMAVNANRQRLAVMEIRKHCGTVLYDYQLDDSEAFKVDSQLPGPDWLRRLLGDDYFTSVVYVSVTQQSGMEQLAALDRLKRFDLSAVSASDSWLVNLRGLSQLETLSLSGTQITDSGLASVSELTQLKVLGLAETRITDAGLKKLNQMTNLRDLLVSRTHVTTEGVSKLRRALPSCRVQY